MVTYYDNDGDIVFSTTFSDASGRRFIDGVEVPAAVWDEFQAACTERDSLAKRVEQLGAMSRIHLSGCRGAKARMRDEIERLRTALGEPQERTP